MLEIKTENISQNSDIQDSRPKSSDQLYLDRLEFRPELKKTWLNFFVSRTRVVLLLIILISMWGISSFIRLPRESNPEVKIPIAVVVTAYPGVSPSDIEELVTKKLEAGISGLKGIDKITSRSANSVSSITVEFGAKEDLDSSLRSLRDEVNSLKNELPEDATDPVVREISFDDTPIYTIALSGPFDGLALRGYADDLKDELEKISGVREVNVFGGDELEFEIAYDPGKLAAYGISPDQANGAVAALNLAVPAGNFEGSEFIYPVRTDSRFYDEKKLGAVPILSTEQGAIVYLKDIATVKKKAIERTVVSRLSSEGAESREAVTISIVKKTGGNIIETVDQARSVINGGISKMPEGVHYDEIVDMAGTIKSDFDRLIHDFLITFVLVFGVLFLIVGLKEALVAGLAIPLTFFVAFGVMMMTGITLNFLSIFSLILSLGLLVDDAIVVVSATKQYLRTGKFTPEEAVLLVLNDFKVVLTTTTLTTVWAFLPLLSSTGIIGSFIKSIPITVSVTLIASLLIALMVNHPLAAVLERIRLTPKLFYFNLAVLAAVVALPIFARAPELYVLSGAALFSLVAVARWYRRGGRVKLAKNQELSEREWDDDDLIKEKLSFHAENGERTWGDRIFHGLIDFSRILPFYEKYLCQVTCTKKARVRTLAAVAGLFLIAIALPITGVVPSEFFPPSNQDIIYANLRASTGLKLSETDKIVRQVEEQLRKYPEVINFSTVVGQSSTEGSIGGGASNSHLASFTINLKKAKDREIASYDLADQIRDDMDFIKDAEVTVSAPRGGPPSGSAFEARILGEDLRTLDKIANDLKPTLSSITGVINADISLKSSPAEYTFTLDSARLKLYGLTAAAVGSTLRQAISGVEVTKVIQEGKEEKVIARFAEDKIPTLTAVENLQILNDKRQPVFLKDAAKIELKPSVEAITRIDQKRAVLLSADAQGKTRPAAILQEFQDKVKKDYQLPEGYEIAYGGENEQNQESVISIIQAMAIAGLLIISTMVIQFNSFRQSLIVLAAIPLALIGVFIGMAIARVNLSFPGLIGILALFGIVVKNSIILVDKINLNIKAGIPFMEAVSDAGKSRLEAIFITSICTILGIIPITLSDETWMALGSTIIFGLMLSSFFTLFVIPVLYIALMGRKEKKS